LRRAVPRPGLAELTPLVEHVSATVSGLYFVTDRVGERHFANLARRVCLFGAASGWGVFVSRSVTSGTTPAPRSAANMAEILVGVRGFEPPAPASRRPEGSGLPAQFRPLPNSAYSHIIDGRIVKLTVRGVPSSDHASASRHMPRLGQARNTNSKEPATNQKELLDTKSPIQVRIHLPPAESQQTFGPAEDADVSAGLGVWIALTFPSREIRRDDMMPQFRADHVAGHRMKNRRPAETDERRRFTQ